MKKTPVADEIEELTTWRRRVRQAQQVARLLAANQSIHLISTAQGLTLGDPPPQLGSYVYDNHGRIMYRIIGADLDSQSASIGAER